MIVSTGVSYRSPVSATRRAPDPTPSTPDAEPTDKPTSSQFAAIMTLLAGTSADTRASLLKQADPASVSTLDKLLSASDETVMISAADAARYGMLLGNTKDDTPVAATTTTASPLSASELAGLVSRSGSSVEQLLALGATKAAAAKAKLNAILANAANGDAAALAAANALAAALAASTADPTTPIKNTDGLDPEFRARLEAVMQRMKDEFGSNVTVVETVRSQDRQNILYAQGRTTPGQVVTQTLNSNHTLGRAADVIVDGSWNNEAGFARLQQIANEEGLHTIPNDPGHLELKPDASTKAAAQPTAALNGIAQVAAVATVATVASTSSITPTDKPLTATAPAAPLGVPAAVRHVQHDASPSTDTSSDKSKDKSSNTSRLGAEGGLLNDLGRPDARYIGPLETIDPPASSSAASAADRVQSINELRAGQPASMSQITLEIDGPNGDTQHVTVDMRGNTVGTQITTDPASADRMRGKVGELQGALEGHGLQVDTVHISSVKPADATETVKQASASERDAMRLGGAASSGANDGALQQGPRDRSSATRDWEDKQAQREEQKRNARQQQDRSRPQYQEQQ